MTISRSQILTVLALLGLVSSVAVADESAKIPEEVEGQINSLLESGLITIDLATNKPVIHVDVLNRLRDEGRLNLTTARIPDVCIGGP